MSIAHSSIWGGPRRVHADIGVAVVFRALPWRVARLTAPAVAAAHIRVAVLRARAGAFGVHSADPTAMALCIGVLAARFSISRLAEPRVGVDACQSKLRQVDVGPRSNGSCTITTCAL